MKIALLLLLALIGSPVLAAPSISGTSGTLTHGQNVTVSGSAFGSRPTAAPLRSDDFEAGTVGANITGWNITSTISSMLPEYAAVARTGTPGSKSALQAFGNGNYNSGIGVSGHTTKKWYVSGWVKGSTSGSPSRNVKLVSFRGANLSDPEGRLDQYPNTNSGHIYTADCNGTKTQDSWAISGTLIINDGNWHRFEAWIDLGTPNGGDGLYQVWKDTVTWGGVLSGTMITSDCSFAEVHVQHYYATDTGTQPTANYWWDELYIDTSRARVEIGNASTWAASTHRELQTTSAWSSTSATFKLNRGSFAPGSSVYLFVVDDSGAASAGYPITLDSGGGTATYTVTPSAGANGSISPNTAQIVNSGSSTFFTVTPSANYTASVGGTCGGSLAGDAYTTNAITANCTVSATFSSIADTTPPTISAALPSGEQPYGTTSVTLQVTTDEAATCRYSATDVAYASMGSTFGTTGGTSHQQTGFSVSSGNSYTRYVRCIDGSGNASAASTLITFSVATTPDIVLDNTGAGASQSGEWSTSTSSPGYYGTNYHYAPDAAGYWFQWTTALTAGSYAVYARWPAAAGRPSDAVYEITHSGGTASVPANQTIDGNQWNVLGTYTFGSTGTVRLLSSATGTEGAAADAIRFTQSAADTTPPTLSGLSPTGTLARDTTTTTITVATSETAECRHSTTPVFDWDSGTTYTATNSTTHSSPVPTTPGKVNRIYTVCRDLTGNQSAPSAATFFVPRKPMHKVW